MSTDLQPGQVLDKRFKIVELINRGGMACIYQALDRKTGRSVALKVPLLKFESDAGWFSGFQREEEIGLTLNHPYLLKIMPAEGKSRPYIVTEFLEGQTLAKRLTETRPLPEAEGVRIASQICEALAHVHSRGVVHRDLKPDNIMLCEDGSIRIMDFGIAKARQARRLTFGALSPTMGTPDYIAPEQVKGKRGDQRTDLYSLGAILYEMTTGSVPYEGDSPYVIMNARVTGDPAAPRKVNPKLTPVVEEIILHAMERDPVNRYASAMAMKGELDDYEQVPLVGRFAKLRPPQIRRTRFGRLHLVAIFAAAQVLIFFLLYWHFHHHKNPAPHKADGRSAAYCSWVQPVI